MVEQLRFVGPTDRVLHIKSLPMWQDLSAADVLPLALAAREAHFEPGELMLSAQEPAPHALLLVDGQVRVRTPDKQPATLSPPHGVGFLSVLTRDKLGVDVFAETSVIALRIAREDLRRAHEDNFRLFERCLRQIAELAADSRPSLMPFASAQDDDGAESSQPFEFVERLLWLSDIEPFRRASLESVAEVTRRQSSLVVEAGSTIWQPGEPSSFFLGLVDGALQCDLPGVVGGMPVRSDWLVGLADALAERPRACRLTAVSRSRMLRMEKEALLGVLEDDPALRTSLLEVLASRVVGAGPSCLTGVEGWQRMMVPAWVEGGLPPAAALGGWKPRFP